MITSLTLVQEQRQRLRGSLVYKGVGADLVALELQTSTAELLRPVHRIRNT